MNKWLRLGLLVVGLGAFAYFIFDADPAKIKAAFVGEPLMDLNGNDSWDEGEAFEDVIENKKYNRGLGWLGLLVLIPYAVVFTIDTIGWTFTFGPTALKGMMELFFGVGIADHSCKLCRHLCRYTKLLREGRVRSWSSCYRRRPTF